MKQLYIFLILLIALSLSACSTSRVVLLDNGKDANAIIIKTKGGEVVLDEVNTYADLSSSSTVEIKPLSSEELEQTYGKLIADAPKAPIHFLLYFEPNAINLNVASKMLLPKIEQAINDRIPCDVNIIGHADSTGSKEYNINLSLKRARQVRQWLYNLDLNISTIIVESYGEEDPLIPTADGVPEPRNRRVEILVR